nr:hypothetical protein [Tanacetum cinerariifolium]
MQTQTSNTLHNAIMEAGSKDRPPMLAPGNYVQWKSIIKRYINTKPNYELIHHCLKNPPYKFTWADKEVPISKGSPVTRTESHMETYKIISQDIHDQLNAEAEAVQIILTGIDNDIYSTVDACPNACEMWKAIIRLKQSESINYQNEVNEIRAERIARTANPLALVSQKQPMYHPQTHPTHYTQNSSTRSQQAATRNNRKAIANSSQPIYDQEPSMVTEDDETSKEKEIDKLMALISLSENLQTYQQQPSYFIKHQDDTDDDELEDQELEAHYMYMEQLQKVSPDAADSGPIFDVEPLQKVSNDDHYNVFAIESEHPEQSKSTHDTYTIEQDTHNVIIDSLDISYDRKEIDQNDDDNDLANERELLTSLIEKLKCEIDESKNRNKFLETSNKVLIEKLKGEIEDFKNKNKSLESSNKSFKEANNKLSEKINLLFTDFKKSQAELARRNGVEYASKMEIDCAKARGDLISYKMESQKKDFSKSKSVTQNNVSNDFLKSVTAQTLPPNKKSILKNTNVRASGMYKLHTEPTQARTLQLPQDSRKTKKRVSFSTGVILTTCVSRPQLKSNPMEDRVLLNNSRGKKQEVEDQCRNVKLSKNKTSVTECNDSLNAKTLDVNFVSATCGKYVLKDKHDMCVLNSVAKPLKKIVALKSNQKTRNITRKLYERVSRACSWWYPKFTPSGYKWKPKSRKENIIRMLVSL